jgi:hypothetical protein
LTRWGGRATDGEVAKVLTDLDQALPCLQAAAPNGPEAGEHATILDELTELLTSVRNPA